MTISLPNWEVPERSVGIWQILSPVRSWTGGVTGLNWLIRRTLRAGDTARGRRTHALPNPIGADEILYHDKVMCAVNQPRKAKNLKTGEYQDGEVANGEIGMAVGWPARKGPPRAVGGVLNTTRVVKIGGSNRVF